MTTGVLLMTYGSPRDLDDVPAYLERIRGGRPPTAETVAEFKRRYAAIGGSPLVRLTSQQADHLETWLNATSPDQPFVAAAGMRFSAPTLADAAANLAARGATRLLGLIMSPQYSPILMQGYVAALDAAAADLGLPARTVGAWHLDPGFLEVLAQRVRLGLMRFDAAHRDAVPVLLTAPSLPKRVVDREPDYVDQLKATAVAVAERAGLAPDRWQFVYQSAGHTPEEWLKPDLLDVLPALAAQGHRQVLVAPVQFLADHLETLYDVDVAGRRQAEDAGIERFARVPAPNEAPDFVAALGGIVRAELARWEAESADARPVGAPA